MGETITTAPEEGLFTTGRITADDVLALRSEIFGDGIVLRAEAEALFTLHTSSPQQCEEWTIFFVEAVTDYIVHQEKPEGYISAKNADWLVSAITKDRMVASMVELELLVKVLEQAKRSPDGLSAFALRQVMHAVVDGKGPLMTGGELQTGLIAKPEVDLLRRILYAFGGDGNVGITRSEAEILFTINERTANASNDPSWNDLFVKAIANFVMCSSGYASPTREEALQRDSFFERADADVGGFFSRMVSGGVRGILDAYTSAPDVDTAFGTRNASENDSAQRAEKLDGVEAEWLAERIGRDRLLQDNEVALLQFIKQASPEIHPALKPLMDKVA